MRKIIAIFSALVLILAVVFVSWVGISLAKNKVLENESIIDNKTIENAESESDENE